MLEEGCLSAPVAVVGLVVGKMDLVVEIPFGVFPLSIAKRDNQYPFSSPSTPYLHPLQCRGANTLLSHLQLSVICAT